MVKCGRQLLIGRAKCSINLISQIEDEIYTLKKLVIVRNFKYILEQ